MYQRHHTRHRVAVAVVGHGPRGEGSERRDPAGHHSLHSVDEVGTNLRLVHCFLDENDPLPDVREGRRGSS